MGSLECNAGGNPAMMDYHPIKWGVNILWSLHATETWITSGLMGQLARLQTSPYFGSVFCETIIPLSRWTGYDLQPQLALRVSLVIVQVQLEQGQFYLYCKHIVNTNCSNRLQFVKSKM